MIIGLDEYRGKYDFSNVRGIIHVGAVQGFGLDVLKVEDFTLDRIDHVFCEINSDKLYENSPTVDEINSLLSAKGFTLRENWLTRGSCGDDYLSRI
jgi:hypothetical protein